MRISWTFLLLTTLVALCAGAAVATAVAISATDEREADADTQQLLPVAVEDFEDLAALEAVLEQADPTRLASPTGGVITRLDCEAGAEWHSGEVAFEVEGRTVTALATEVPLWRDLSVGDVGSDVSALNTELGRLGFDIVTDDVFDESAVAAVATLIGPPESGTSADFSPERVIWIPHEHTLLGSCQLSIGESVQPTQTIATSEPTVSSLTLTYPEDVLPGLREVSINDATTTVNVESGGENAIGDASIAAAASALLKDTNAPGPEGAPLTVTVSSRLVSPLQVVAVAPSSVSRQDGETCIHTPSGALAATVVESSLGVSYVMLDPGVKAPSHVIAAPQEPSCG